MVQCSKGIFTYFFLFFLFFRGSFANICWIHLDHGYSDVDTAKIDFSRGLVTSLHISVESIQITDILTLAYTMPPHPNCGAFAHPPPTKKCFSQLLTGDRSMFVLRIITILRVLFCISLSDGGVLFLSLKMENLVFQTDIHIFQYRHRNETDLDPRMGPIFLKKTRIETN